MKKSVKEFIGKRQNKIIVSVASAVIAVGLSLAIALPIVLRAVPETPFVIPESKLPTEEKFALTKYDLEGLDDVQTTLRADTMNVTKRNLPRMTPEMLSDEFSLIYDSSAKRLSTAYGSYAEKSGESVASIDFGGIYPAPGHGISAGQFQSAAATAGITTEQYFTYYKYMLMTQGQHLAHEASVRSARSYKALDDTTPRTSENSLTGWLKKHPSADAQYGAVRGENNAVEKVITLDPLYRAYHATGLYLPAGEVVKVKVEGLAPGESISIRLGEQNTLAWRGGVPAEALSYVNSVVGGNYGTVNFGDSATSDYFFKQADLVTALGKFYDYNTSSTPFLQSQWARQNARAPWLSASFTFNKDGEYEIGFAFGGVIHIYPGNSYSAVKTTITGAVETPHYILGVTTPEYFDEYLRDAPGVIAVLDTENGQLIGPTGEAGSTSYMRRIKKDEVEKLAMLWHSFFSVNESFTGGAYNRYNKVMFDWHVPAGAAVALGGYTFACPTGWFDGAMNYRGLLAAGQWGILHEVGHNHAASYGTVWGFGEGKEGEVRNNCLTVLGYIMFCDVGTSVRMGKRVEHGGYANPYSTLGETLNLKGKYDDYSNSAYGYFQCVGMYANIMHSFGAEKYYELLYTYKSVPSYSNNKRADFAYRCSLVYGMNFRKYFNECYAANITDGMYQPEQLELMNALPDYQPVACYYAGGIDGVKTAGDYEVAFGEDLTFDLKSNTISTLDTAESKGFEIISVEQPEHGSIYAAGDGVWKYSFDKAYTGANDEFSFTVKLSDGVIHRLTITLRISYNGARVTTYSGVTTRDLDEALAQVEDIEPTVANATNPAISYTSPAGVMEAKVLEYYFKVPESGNYVLALRGDDKAYAYFGESFESLEKVMTLTHDSKLYSDGISYAVALEKDKYYPIRVFNLNTGGGGNAAIGIKKEGESSYADIKAADAFHPSYPLGQKAEAYVFEPQFIVSKKDNIKISNSGTDKSEWSVLEAPDGNRINDGRYIDEPQYDNETHEMIGSIRTDKWDWLIDGLTNTIFHTSWRGAGTKHISETDPDVFIIDTAREQTFNYFKIITRLTQNDDARITKYRLSLSSDNVNYKIISENISPETAENTLSYVNTGGTKVANLSFNSVSGRYWKLEVADTTGKNSAATYTIISELDAGIVSNTQQVVASTSRNLFTTSGWTNSANLPDEPNGFMVANGSNEKMVVRFRGESFALYAATGSDYGAADVYLDGRKYSSFDTRSDKTELRKLVVNIDNLEDKEHTVEIITTSAAKVMVNVIGIPYTASLVNAPNIYLERALTISLVVFVLLFAAVAAFVAVLIFVPKFRGMVFGNRIIEKLDNREKKLKKQKTAEKAPAETEPVQTATVKTEPVKTQTASATKPAATAKTDTKPAATAKPAVTAKAETKPAAAAKPVQKTAVLKPAAKAEEAKTKVAPKPAPKPATKPAVKPAEKKNSTPKK